MDNSFDSFIVSSIKNALRIVCSEVNRILTKRDLVGIQDLNPMVVKVQGFILAIWIRWENWWNHLKPKFEVSFSDVESKTFPTKVLDGQFDVVHNEFLQLGVVGKRKDENRVQIHNGLTRPDILDTIW